VHFLCQQAELTQVGYVSRGRSLELPLERGKLWEVFYKVCLQATESGKFFLDKAKTNADQVLNLVPIGVQRSQRHGNWSLSKSIRTWLALCLARS